MEEFKHAFLSVTDLAIAKMNYTWLDVRQCLKVFPAIRNLSVSFNAIENLEIPSKDSNFMNLRELILEKNVIYNWEEVLKLGCLSWLVQVISIIGTLTEIECCSIIICPHFTV